MQVATKTIYIIINPKSGTSGNKNISQTIKSIIDKEKYEATIFITEYAGHGSLIARDAVAKGIDIVVAVGGDGTVNEVGAELIHTNTILGVIPLGSGNGLARDLGISRNITKALKIIDQAYVRTIDYGKVSDGVEEKIFFCTCGMGFDAEVAYQVAGKKRRGAFMYFKTMLEMFFKQKPNLYEITVGGETIKEEAFVVTCANASQYGYDAYIAPHADIQDGKMNIAILQPLKLKDVPKTSAQLFTRDIDDNKKMKDILTQKAIIKRERKSVIHIDGDALEMGCELAVEIVSQGLKVIVPENPPRKNPLHPQELVVRIMRAFF